MTILLLSMPDSFEHTPPIAIRIPCGALTSLAGNLPPHHRVAVADLVLVQSRVRETVERLMHDVKPEVVGFSVMTFQRETARRLIALVRTLSQEVRVVVGGYDPSLAPEAWTHPDLGVDVIVRGEGEVTFRELIDAIEAGRPLAQVRGLWVREGRRFRHTAPRPVTALEDGSVQAPNRAARVLTNYTFLGRPIDVVETSRGCTFDCSFCSIIEMRGRNFYRFPLERVVADIADARARGARVIFLVDDNITLDVNRFAALCRAIIDAGLDDLDYLVQAMTAPIAAHGQELGPLMQRAGFRYVFLGIESILDEDLEFLKAGAKNRWRPSPTGGRDNATLEAIRILHRHGMFIVGGLIVGNPDDTAESIRANLDFGRRYVDWPYFQHPTPYPGTPLAREFEDRGLVVSTNVTQYDGTTAVVRSEHLDPEDIEFMRWTHERWMKVRHLPVAFRHDPLFVLRHGGRMLAHTFRGTRWRTWLGLEHARAAFRRYQAIRQRERQYVDWPDPLSSHDSTEPVQPPHGATMSRALALVLALCLAGPAGAVEWRRVEGSVDASPAVRTLDGDPLAQGTFRQWVDAGRLRVQIVSEFTDGRRIEETADFRQEPELMQDTWSWRETKQDELVREYEVNIPAGIAIARKDDGRRLREWSAHVRVEPGRTFLGYGFSLALQGLRARLVRGEEVTLRGVGFTPRPRVVSVEVSYGGVDEMRMGGQLVRGDRFRLHAKVPWIARLIVSVPDSTIWLTRQPAEEASQFLRWEGFLVEPDDEMVRVDVLAGGDSSAAVAVDEQSRAVH